MKVASVKLYGAIYLCIFKVKALNIHVNRLKINVLYASDFNNNNNVINI